MKQYILVILIFISVQARADKLAELAIEALMLANEEVHVVGEEVLHAKCEENSEVHESCRIDGTSNEWRLKCEKLFESDIPPKALKYALKVMEENATSFKTSKCFDSKGLKASNHPSMMGLTGNKFENDLMADGLPNKCQMIINDTDDRSPSPKGDNCRGRMYYIDLCKSGDSPVVKKDYFNLGTGTCRGGKYGFRNQSKKHTTVLGAFFTHTKTFDFTNTTKQVSQYRRVANQVKKLGGPKKAVALQLFGLQNTNNLSSRNGKYIHVSPHRSSWGCPSVHPKNYYMIEALAKNGPGLVVNWANKGMEEISECAE